MNFCFEVWNFGGVSKHSVSHELKKKGLQKGFSPQLHVNYRIWEDHDGLSSN